MSLGMNLRAAREGAGLSREVLAVRAGVSASTVSRIEAGGYRPRLATLDALAAVLGVTVDALLAEPMPKAVGL